MGRQFPPSGWRSGLETQTWGLMDHGGIQGLWVEIFPCNPHPHPIELQMRKGRRGKPRDMGDGKRVCAGVVGVGLQDTGSGVLEARGRVLRSEELGPEGGLLGGRSEGLKAIGAEMCPPRAFLIIYQLFAHQGPKGGG